MPEATRWADYQKKAAVTAIYPGVDCDHNGIFYPSFGLVDEIGEAFKLVDSYDNFVRDKLIKEISDVLWYIARVHAEWGLDFEDTERVASEVEEAAPTCSIHEMLAYMMTNAAKVCGVTKKYLRDENFQIDHPSQKKRTQVQFYLGCIFNALYSLLEALNVSLESVMQINLDKLYSRMERGKLQGSGDNR